ncbi:MAG: HAD-IA family hydrolase [Clostridiales Family XIII bacterium]|jgi:pyrophosphatase PpaX|nr:HAD-IA family hydrolase [Clostridiales Family XIII bacterium]
MSNRRIDTVLLDFDGTLMDTNDLVIRSWQHAFRTLTGKDGSPEDILRSFGEPIENTVAKFFPDREEREAVQAYRTYHHEEFENSIKLFPGIVNLLDALKSEGYTLGLVTSRLRRTAKIGMEKFDLFRYFDSFVTVDDTENAKPDPAPILLSLDNLRKTPESAIMVGDTLHDIHCARNAGVLSALVSWTLAVPEHKRTGANEPDFIVGEPTELMDILQELNR